MPFAMAARRARKVAEDVEGEARDPDGHQPSTIAGLGLKCLCCMCHSKSEEVDADPPIN